MEDEQERCVTHVTLTESCESMFRDKPHTW
jgi:hypothetical protein